jgi:hypothetical protein
MEISADALLKGKSTIIKNREYLPTREYAEPFFEKLSKVTDNFIIQVKEADQMSLTKDSKDVVYNRVWIQAVLPDKYTVDNHAETYGLIYGLDVRKPVAKIYRGVLNKACLNLCVFDPSWLNIQELKPDEPINYSSLKELVEKENNMHKVLEGMKNEYFVREDKKIQLGEWVDFTISHYDDKGFDKIRIPSSVPIEVYKDLYLDSDSKYFVPGGINPSKFQVYNAFTDIISHDKKDIVNIADKTILLSKLLNVSVN